MGFATPWATVGVGDLHGAAMLRPGQRERPAEKGNARPMRADGFYWVRIIEHGSRTILLYRDGAWVVDVATEEEDVVVLKGPLVPPTPEELARQEAHFAARLESEWKQYGCDPRWDGRWLQGLYWVRCAGTAEPEIALFMEGTWGGLDWDDDWYVREGEPSPEVLTGPLNAPGGLPKATSQ